AADHVWPRTETRAPKAIGDHSDRLLDTHRGLLIGEEPALCWRRAEQREDVPRHEAPRHPLRLLAPGEIHALTTHHGERIEAPGLLLPVEVIEIDDTILLYRTTRSPDEHHSLSMRPWQRTQQNASISSPKRARNLRG